ncbi:hypothetical protein J6590_082626 [Homalodisca vitripennis]|nr:hypothetical protein J6590_082626 [Homalodisca vitripennis]
MSKEEYTGKCRSWTCTDCEESGLTNTEIVTQLSEDKITVERPDVTILALLNEMREFRSEVRKTNSGFANQMEKYSEWIIENGKKIDDIGKSMEKVVADISVIYQENAN